MTLKVGIEADFDPSKVEAQLNQFRQDLNAFSQQVSQANKTSFNPIGPSAFEDMQRMKKEFEVLLRIQGDLRKRIKDTNQEGKGFEQLDWNKLYPNQASRNKQMATVLQYVMGANHAPIPPAGGGTGGGGGGTPPVPPPPPAQPSPAVGGGGGFGGNLTQQLLRSLNPLTGGIAGVGAGALGTGMRSGFGSGIAGLFGGILALGVGKLVSNIADRMNQAEDNAVAYDKLKRTLGDVNVSFGTLKGVIADTSSNVKLTFSETAKLATDYARAGNLSSDQFGQVSGELRTSVGFARAFGLDPSQAVGVMGQMRGVGVTRNEQETRRFALLIGETIGKSGAFAKADEVLESIANYATTQTRNNLGTTNTAGYAALFSGLAGSGIAGLDPSGVSNLLAHVNAVIASGGAKGEASQFFTGLVGNRLGLDPIQTQMMREGGAFSTKSSTFGDGSIWSKFMGGGSKLGGNQTMLDAQLAELRAQYGSNKGLLAQATANHLGVNMGQAMALHLIQPNQMGEMQKYADLTQMSGSGIGNLTKALYGSDSDRAALAAGLRARGKDDSPLSDKERAKLDSVMAGSDKNKQRDLLATLVASRDQERTQGSDIRDSKNSLDNIKTQLADQLIPITLEMRHGIMAIAGEGKKSPREIMRSVIEMDSKDKTNLISSNFDNQINPLAQKRADLLKLITNPLNTSMTQAYAHDPVLLKKKRDELANAPLEIKAINSQIKELQKIKAEKLGTEADRLKAELKDFDSRYSGAKKTEELLPTTNAGGVKKTGKGSATFTTGDPLADAVALKESGAKHRNKDGSIVTSPKGARGLMQLMPATAKNPGYGVRPAMDDSEEENIRVGKDYLAAMLKLFGGDERKALAAYNAGPGATRKAIKKANERGGDWLRFLPAETRNYVPSVLDARQGNPLPVGDKNKNDGRVSFNMTADPLEIILRNDKMEQLGGSHYLNPRVGAASPFGFA